MCSVKGERCIRSEEKPEYTDVLCKVNCPRDLSWKVGNFLDNCPLKKKIFYSFWGTGGNGISALAGATVLLTQNRNGKLNHFKSQPRGTWVAQSVERPTSAQVMISRSVSSSPAWGSVLTAQSLEPASDSVSPSLSAPPLFMLCLSLSQK